MKIIKRCLFVVLVHLMIVQTVFGQANPTISVLPGNSGLVAVGATLDLQIDVGNTGVSSIPIAKLRPIIQIPPSVVFLPNSDQTGLPPGWTILSNTGTQLRFCNTSFVIPSQTVNIIILKVRGVSIAPSQTFTGQINFGNGTTCAAGPTVSGNNTADDFATSTIQVVPGCGLGISATASIIQCNNGTSNITAIASNNTGPVEYSLNGVLPYQASNVFNNVTAGTYSITAREVNNPTTCIISTTINIDEPAAVPAPSVDIIQPSCNNSNAVVTVTNNTTGFNYSIDGSPFVPYPTGGYNLPTGAHSLIAKDLNDCTSNSTTFTINDQPVTPQTPIIGIITQPDCSNSSGSVQLSNLPLGNWTINPGNIIGNTTSTIITNLAAGTYSFTVTNDVGCTSSPSNQVNIIAVVGAPQAPDVIITQPTCTSPTGSLIITSATTELTFSLDNAPFSAYPIGGYSGIAAGAHNIVSRNVSGCLSPFTNFIIQDQPTSPVAPTVTVMQPSCTISTGTILVTSPTSGITFSLDGAPFVPYPSAGFITTAGTHTLAVQNLTGCAPNITTNIIVNDQPATPTVVVSFTPITCFNASSTITATAAGGVPPYEYSINGGVFQSQNIFTTVSGTYVISVKDSNGCVGSSNSISIPQPTAIIASGAANPIACNGGNTILNITANGGLGTYEYSLNNGSYQSSNSFSVTAGTYNINVRLANNPSCSTSSNTSINITQPNVLRVNAVANAITTCGGNTTARISVTGGTAPYTGIGDFVRGPGNFNFEVVDAKGCISDTNLFIFPPGCVDIEVFPNPAHDIIKVNHTAAVGTNTYLQIFSENGVRVLSYNVPQNNFISTINISTLASGTYVMVYLNGDEKKSMRFIKTNK